MNIDEIIARSAQAGAFSDRQSFTVARELAIQKMRQFALADPHYYVLELIQAAVANQATYIDMRIGSRDFVLSYVGGGFAKTQLAQIFDFLFAARTDVETGDIRQLALGLNALMRFEPERVTLESGDGTLAGTTRVEVDPGKNLVEVGTPDAALHGTFLRAVGLNRSKLSGRSLYQPTDYGPPECAVIEERCLAAPIPILVNGHSPFGYARVRTPKLLGFEHVVDFDEGDFYGSIGVARKPHHQGFKLLTWGVWVQSLDPPGEEGAGLGGVITYNGFNKTADHAAIVRDGQFEAFHARLRPYIQQVYALSSGRDSFQVRALDGELLGPPQLRQLGLAHDVLVTIQPAWASPSPQNQRACDIARLFHAPILVVSDDHFDALVGIVGSSAQVLRPVLDDSADLELLATLAASPPERAMLPDAMAALEACRLDTEELLKRLKQGATSIPRYSKYRADELFAQLGGAQGVHVAGVLTPLDFCIPATASGTGVWAQVLVLNAPVWQGLVDSPHVGHVLQIHVAARAPSVLLAPCPFNHTISLAEGIARIMVVQGERALADASAQALRRLTHHDTVPGTVSAHLALAALARESIMQLAPPGADEEANIPRIHFHIPPALARLNLLELPLFETMDKRRISFRDLEEIMRHTCGLVYGVVDGVPADMHGLDVRRILALDPMSEVLLAEIVGYGAYIRVDARDVLARSADGRWEVRDLAIGLREYPEAALLLEGEGARAKETPTESVIKELVRELVTCSSYQPHVQDDWEVLEARRQATRHLQYFVCRRQLVELERPTYYAEKLPLFLDEHGCSVSLAQITAGFLVHDLLVMADGRAAGGTYAARATQLEAPRVLMLNPWSYHLLRPLGTLVGAGSVAHPSEARALEVSTQQDACIVGLALDSAHYQGFVGLPRDTSQAPVVRMISPTEDSPTHRLTTTDYGLVGTILLKEEPSSQHQILFEIHEALQAGELTPLDSV